MEKLLIITLVVCAIIEKSTAGVISFPTDGEEVAYLSHENKVFSDFCLASRNRVFDNFKSLAPQTATELNKFGNRYLRPEYLAAPTKALSRFLDQVKDPNIPIEGLDENNTIDLIIESGLNDIRGHSKNDFSSYLIALNYAWFAYNYQLEDEMESLFPDEDVSEDVVEQVESEIDLNRSSVKEILDQIRERYYELTRMTGPGELSKARDTIEEFGKNCSIFNEHLSEIKRRFDETKAQLKINGPSSVEDVNCLTIRQIISSVAVCKFIETAEEPLKVNS